MNNNFDSQELLPNDSSFSADGGQEIEYIGFWQRSGAYVIDGHIFMVVYGLGMLGVLGSGENSSDVIGKLSALENICFILWAIYFICCESSKMQGTFGKKLAGFRVVTYAEQKISIVQAVIRFIAAILNYITIFIGYIMIGFTKKNQGLHDIIAKTYVIKERKSHLFMGWLFSFIAVIAVYYVVFMLHQEELLGISAEILNQFTSKYN